MEQTIMARRGTEQKEFSRAAWDLLPADKYGWKQEVEVPDEIKAALKGAVSNAPDPAADIEPEAPVAPSEDSQTTKSTDEPEAPAPPAAPSETASEPTKTVRKGAGK